MDNTKFKIYDRTIGVCDDAVRLCTDNKTKNDIWDKTMTKVTIVGIPHDFFYAIQRELEDEYSI
jgi:hypothetical protein